MSFGQKKKATYQWPKDVWIRYCFFNQSFTWSGDMIASTNIYAPVLGDFTILMALVRRLDPVCNDATDFFAIT